MRSTWCVHSRLQRASLTVHASPVVAVARHRWFDYHGRRVHRCWCESFPSIGQWCHHVHRSVSATSVSQRERNFQLSYQEPVSITSVPGLEISESYRERLFISGVSREKKKKISRTTSVRRFCRCVMIECSHSSSVCIILNAIKVKRNNKKKVKCDFSIILSNGQWLLL